MTRPYSNDLRQRVVRAHLAGDPLRSMAARSADGWLAGHATIANSAEEMSCEVPDIGLHVAASVERIQPSPKGAFRLLSMHGRGDSRPLFACTGVPSGRPADWRFRRRHDREHLAERRHPRECPERFLHPPGLRLAQPVHEIEIAAVEDISAFQQIVKDDPYSVVPESRGLARVSLAAAKMAPWPNPKRTDRARLARESASSSASLPPHPREKPPRLDADRRRVDRRCRDIGVP